MAGMIIGAVVKYATGSAIAGFIASYAVDALLASQQSGQHTYGSRLGNSKIQSSTEGAAIKKVYGADRVAGNLIWSGGIKETSHTQESGGGKGGAPSNSHTTYTYDASFAIALCEGEIVGVRKIWADNTLIYSKSDTATADELAVSDQAGITIFTGAEDQLVSSTIEAVEGVGSTPAFRGTSYVLFDIFQLETYGNRIPTFTCEVVASGSYTAPTPSAYVEIGTNGYRSNAIRKVSTDVHMVYGTSGTSPTTETLKEVLISTGGVETVLNTIQHDWGIQQFDTDDGFSTGQSDDGSFMLPHFAWDTVNNNGYDAFINRYKDGSIVMTTQFISSPVNNNIPTLSSIRYSILSDEIWLGIRSHGLQDIEFKRIDSSGNWYTIQDPNTLSGVTVNLALVVISTKAKDGFAYFVHSNTEITGLGGAVITRYATGTDTIDSHMNVPNSAAGGVSSIDIVGEYIYFYQGQYYYKQKWGSSSKTFIFYNIGSIFQQQGSSQHGQADWVGTNNYTVATGSFRTPFKIDTAFSYLQIESAALSDIVTNLCELEGLTAADIDVTALVGISVRGFTRSNPMSARATLKPLMDAYHLTATESDYKLVFEQKHGNYDIAVTATDLSARSGGAEVDRLKITRTQEVELPRRIEVVYPDFDGDYQDGNQFAQRIKT